MKSGRLAVLGAAAILFTGVLSNLTAHAQQRGWANELMPAGMSRGETRGEYIWTKTGEVMVYVPAGASKSPTFGTAGSPPQPQETESDVNLAAFYIGKYEVTVGTYRKFVTATQYKTEADKLGKATVLEFPKGGVEKPGANWANPGFPQTDQHPVVLIVWDDAKAYCDWAGGRLPTSDEWIKAALWDDAKKKLRILPWGEPPPMSRIFGPDVPPPPPFADAKKGNFLDAAYWRATGGPPPPGFDARVDDGYAYTAPVGSYPEGQSPYGAHDMGGNVSEWVSDLVTPGMRAFFGPQMPTGNMWKGNNFTLPASFPLRWPGVSPPIPGGRLDMGLRLVVPGR